MLEGEKIMGQVTSLPLPRRRRRTDSAFPWDDMAAVEAQYGERGVQVLCRLGRADGSFLLARWSHMLREGPDTSRAQSRMRAAELAALHSCGTWSPRHFAAHEHEEQTYTALRSELAAARTEKIHAYVDETCEIFGTLSNMPVRRAYEAAVTKLRNSIQAEVKEALGTTTATKISGEGKLITGASTSDPSETTRDRANDASPLCASSSHDRSTALRSIAESAHARRRSLATKFKHATAQPLRHYIYFVNMERYGDPMGLGWEAACDKYAGDWQKIIAGACRPNGGINELFSGFRDWLLL